MTDLDNLERLRAVYDRATKCTSLIGAERLSLILDARAMYETALFAAAGELVRDARRYRWLREEGISDKPAQYDGLPYRRFDLWYANEKGLSLDEFVDAAIAQEQP